MRPNAGIRAYYSNKLKLYVEAMHKSVMFWLISAYKNSMPEVVGDGLSGLISGLPPSQDKDCCGGTLSISPREEWYNPSPTTLALDALSTDKMKRKLSKLTRRWQKKFNDLAPVLSKKFAGDASKYANAALTKHLKTAGLEVRLTATRTQRDILKASVEENVALIRSIPSKYLQQVQGTVMRSIQTGRGVEHLAEKLQKQFKITRNRASLIARDQNSKATAAITRARHLELGFEEAIWVHSSLPKEPRPTHVKNSGNTFNIRDGWFDPGSGETIWPGTLISCRCYSRPILPGLR